MVPRRSLLNPHFQTPRALKKSRVSLSRKTTLPRYQGRHEGGEGGNRPPPTPPRSSEKVQLVKMGLKIGTSTNSKLVSKVLIYLGRGNELCTTSKYVFY